MRRLADLLIATTLLAAVAFSQSTPTKQKPSPTPTTSTAGPAPAAGDRKSVVCSYYAVRYNGRRTSSGQRFHSNKLTAAHMSLPLGTRVRLTNPANRRSVVVRVNDRGPYVAGRDISVTRRAARTLGFIKAGVANVEMEVLGK